MTKTKQIICALLFIFQYANAQKITELIQQDTMIHVYKLNDEQVKFALRAYTIRDSDFLFTKPFREYPIKKYKADTLPVGNFLIANITNNIINYSYVYKTPFVITPKVIEDDVILYFSLTKSKKLIQDAKLDLDGTEILYDPGYGGYSFPKKIIADKNKTHKDCFIRIAYADEVYVFRCEINIAEKETPPENYYDNRNAVLNSPGYILFDKPIYKPIDTLNLKAFLVNFKNGNPLRKNAKLYISEPNQQFYLTKQLKRKSPGAFLYTWKIPDTLKLDRDFQVQLRYTKLGRSFIKNGSFKLQEYELNKNKYALDMPTDLFYAGDDINFFATAKDMNGFPVQGTRVHYNLRINEIIELLTDSLTLTNKQKENWYEKDTTIEYENFIETVIPSNILPKANARYTLDAIFIDPLTFEKKVISKQFVKYTQKEKLLFFQQEDSLNVRNLYNLKDTARTYYFMTFGNGDTITKKKITTPFHYQLNPLETSAMIMDKDSFKTVINITYNKLEMTKLKGKRSGDSIQISFQYPFAEPVHYKIYKKDKVVKSGESNTLSFSMLDKSADEYKIILTTNLQNGIVDNFYEMRFVPEKNILHFQKTIPATALPGDSIGVALTVLDYKNNPKRKVNIAAYAANAAFAENIEPPYIDIPEVYKNKIITKPVLSRDYVQISALVASANYVLKNAHFARFNLRKNEYYQLKYPEHERTELKIKKQQAQPEFTLCITLKDILYSPKYILLDDQPIYISDINANATYSFVGTEGKHKMSFRYFDKLYTWNNIELLKNTKHIFGINIDSIKTKGSFLNISDSLPILEPNAAEKKLLYSTLLFTNNFNADSVEMLSEHWNEHKKYYQVSGIPLLNIDGDYYFVQGPLKPNSIAHLKVNNKTFNIQTGIETVNHFDNILKEFIPKKMPEPKGAFLHFGETQLQPYALLTLLKPDTLLPQPIAAPMQYKPQTEKAMQIVEDENFYQNYTASYQDGICRFMIENKNDTTYIKSMWIISKNHFEACDYIQNVSRGWATIYRRAIQEPFDVYLFFNKNRMAILKNQHHTNNDDFYINPTYLKTEKFNKEKIEVPLKIYAELNAVPLLPFYDSPFESKEKIKQTSSSTRGNIYFHGMITDGSQQPLPGTLVYAEINGKFKYGAVTNNNGLFEILDMIPATYQIKIYHPEFKISHFEPLLMENKNEYDLNTTLQAKAVTAPLFESIQNDFRLMAYLRKTQRNILKVSVHEKETRDKLDNVEVKIMYNNDAVKTVMMTDMNFEIPFPEDKEKIYSIELSKPGYTTLCIRQVEFTKNYLFVLEAFMGLEKKEILKRKEFYINMQGQLYEISKEEMQENDNNSEGASNMAPPFPTNKQVISKKEYKASDMSSDDDFRPMRGNNYTVDAGAAPSVVNVNVNMTAPMYNWSESNASAVGSLTIAGSATTLYSVEGSMDGEAEYLAKRKEENIYADASLIDQVVQNKNASSIRKKFSDVGYWKPNLITNKKGMTGFTIKLPDNITAWKSYFVGMGKHWLHGVDSAETRVYKPLQTTSIVPSYFYQEDLLQAKIKFANLTRDALHIQTKILINKQEKLSKQVSVKNTYIDSLWIEAATNDTIAFEGGLIFKEHYKDFEHFDIPVFSTAMKYDANQCLMMDKDSTYTLQIEPNTKGTMIFNNTLYEKVVASINELNKYEYGCVEQTTSKLYGLLLKQRIQKKLNMKVNSNKEINSMLSRLADMQNDNGSFGWWRKNGSNERMTIYAMEITYIAMQDGFVNNIFNGAKDYLMQHYKDLSTSDKIYAYYVLNKSGSVDGNINSMYEKVSNEFLSTTDKIYYYQNKTVRQETVKNDDLYAVFLEINQHVMRPYYDNFFYDYKSDLFKAYSLFKNTSYGKEFISLFRKKLISGEYEKDLNTFAKANMIEALTSDALTDTTKPIQSTLTINDTLKIKTFPYRMQLQGTQYQIKHIGGDVFLNTSEEKSIQTPVIHDSVFAVRTYFMQNNNQVENVTAGTACDFTIDIQAFKSGENVMVEIPIPSGMKVTNKNTNMGDGYVEYYKHKVVYFFNKLNMGTQQLHIQMMPLFKGKFVLPATKVSLMYYQFVYGNNLKRVVSIE